MDLPGAGRHACPSKVLVPTGQADQVRPRRAGRGSSQERGPSCSPRFRLQARGCWAASRMIHAAEKLRSKVPGSTQLPTPCSLCPAAVASPEHAGGLGSFVGELETHLL